MKEPRTGAPPQPHGRGHILAPAYLWVAGLQGWRALTFCAALGAISNLAFPPFHIWPALALGLSGSVPATLAAWAPAGISTLLGLALLFHLEDG